MEIVADENIPYVADAFAALGRVQALPGRAMSAQALKNTDILLVRSVTQIDETLLAGSRVRFVATATIGTDHVDLDYLKKQSIGFAGAPGSNANSVAEYVSTALLVLADRKSFRLRDRTIGIIGVGNVGSRVVRNARAMGMNVLMCDPPRAENPDDSMRDEFISLEKLLSKKPDCITLHVPLERTGKHPTYHMADAAFFERFAEGCIFINTSRGAVHDTVAVGHAIDTSQSAAAVLDVWENEPAIDVELLGKVDIATPHIAGYSFDGKVRGVGMIYRAACEHFGVTPTWEPKLPSASHAHLKIDASGKDVEDVLREAALTVYDISADDERMRGLLGLNAAEVGSAFDRLRREYPIRREFTNTEILLSGGDAQTTAALKELGFRIREV